jgi:hypothetical protein
MQQEDFGDPLTTVEHLNNWANEVNKKSRSAILGQGLAEGQIIDTDRHK